MRSVSHLKAALARQRCRQCRALVLCSVTVEGVMRGIAVLENHADRNACMEKADRGETSRDECACIEKVYVWMCAERYARNEYTMWGVCLSWGVCVFKQRNMHEHMLACMCVCGGVKGSACQTPTCPSMFQVGDFVIFLHSDPQRIDTQMKPNMHMLSRSTHSRESAGGSGSLSIPSIHCLCCTNVTLSSTVLAQYKHTQVQSLCLS